MSWNDADGFLLRVLASRRPEFAGTPATHPLRSPKGTLMEPNMNVLGGSAPAVHVRQMVTLIEERSAEHLCLPTLARSVGRQGAYLGRLFLQYMGVTVHEYLARIRMDRAAGLIRAGEKVEWVSLVVGYRSKKSFYRQFRRRFGMTPAAYRHDTEPEGCVVDRDH